MKIAHFLLGSCNPHSANGVNQTVFHLSRAQAGLGHEVAVFSITPEAPIAIPGVQLRTYAPALSCRWPVGARLQELLGHRSPLNLPRPLRTEIVAWRPDIVHLHVMHIPQNSVFASDLRKTGIPYCFTPHGCLTRQALRRNPVIKGISGLLFERRFLAGAAFLHMVSTRDMEGLAVYRVSAPIVTAPNGIDLKSVPTRLNRGLLRQRYPKTRSARILLYLGRLDVQLKGLDLLVQAMSEVSASTEVVAVLVGPDWRSNLIGLQHLIASRGLTDRVILAGPAYGQDKWDLLASADVFVHPSRSEAGMPFSALEALAAGKPMLLTHAADPSGLVAEHGAGEVVEPEPGALARAIERMSILPDADLGRMGANARQLAEREFNWKPIAQTLVSAYQQACATARTRVMQTAGERRQITERRVSSMLEKQSGEEPARVDVAVPCYQYGRYLRDCVTSVLTQTHRNIRVLIIDNASTDDSLEVAQQLATEDRRVEVVAHRTNIGQHASYNEAIDWASAKYFVMLCADDLLVPGSLARTVGIMERHPDVGFAYGRVITLRPQDPMPVFDVNPGEAAWRIVAGKVLLEQLCRQAAYLPPGTSALMVRTATQKLAGYYRPEVRYTDDLEMCLRLARLGPVAETKAPLAIVRIHGSSLSTVAHAAFSRADRTSSVWHEEDEAAFDSFFAHEGRSLPDAARLHRLARRNIGERAYWSALAHLCLGNAGGSLDLFKFALKRRPTAAILPPVGSLFRRPDTVHKIIWVASGMMRWSRAPAPATRVDG